MKLYYGGAEQKVWRNLLHECGVRTVSLSYVGLLRRTKRPDQFSIRDNISEDTSVFLDSGAYTVNKHPEKYSTYDSILRLANEYLRFVEANLGSFDLASEFDADAFTEEDRESYRNALEDLAGPRFLPIWHAETSERLIDYAGRWGHVGIMGGSEVWKMGPQLNRMVMDHGTRLHGVSMTQMPALEQINWDSVGSTAWLSPAQYGDTLIWTASDELKRYPKNYKDRGRASHSQWLRDNGFNWQLIEDDDSTEMLRLSLWSWQKYIRHITLLNTPQVTQAAETPEMQIEEPSTDLVVQTDQPTRNEIRVSPGKKLLPVIAYEYEEITEYDEEGTPHIVRRPVLSSSPGSLMKCDKCPIQDKCPEHRAGADCVFEIPVSVRVPKDATALWDTVTEIQAQRVLQLRMFEQVSGQGYDPNLGSEMDRLTRIMSAKNKQNTTTVRQVTEVNIPHGEGGFIASMLGQGAADKLRAVDSAQEEPSTVIEAEVIEDE